MLDTTPSSAAPGGVPLPSLSINSDEQYKSRTSARRNHSSQNSGACYVVLSAALRRMAPYSAPVILHYTMKMWSSDSMHGKPRHFTPGILKCMVCLCLCRNYPRKKKPRVAHWTQTCEVSRAVLDCIEKFSKYVNKSLARKILQNVAPCTE